MAGPTVFVALLLSLGAAASPWVWILLRRGTRTSNWGSARAADTLVERSRTTISESFERHLRGRMVWAWSVLGVALLVYLAFLVRAPQHWMQLALGFTACWLTSIVVLAISWHRVGEPNGVGLGLLANFFVQGGLLGASFAIVLNSELMVSWQRLSPTCNPMVISMTAGCEIMAAVMWVLTPGLVEETFKSLWLFFRLRRSSDDVPSTCCFCLPASGAWDCGCWFKLAPTPYHVFLCAMASGAGFECLENLIYVFQHSGVLADLDDPQAMAAMVMVAMARLLTSWMHMVWTGLIGLGLARRLFLAPARAPSLPAVLAPSMLAHGLFDYSLSAMQTAAKAENSGLIFLFFCIAGGALASSVVLFGRWTGCRGLCCGLCLGDGSCLCTPGFWELRYGSYAEARETAPPPMVGLPVLAPRTGAAAGDATAATVQVS